MIIKTNNTDKVNVIMTICIDDKAEEITIHIHYHNKQTGVVNGYDYPAAEYSKALADYKKFAKEEK